MQNKKYKQLILRMELLENRLLAQTALIKDILNKNHDEIKVLGDIHTSLFKSILNKNSRDEELILELFGKVTEQQKKYVLKKVLSLILSYEQK